MTEKIEVDILDNKKPYIVIVHETSFPMISIKLDGTNYRVWSQIIEMHIIGKRNKRYNTRRKAAPVENDPSYDEWEVVDSMIKSWLINSMNDKPMAHFVQCRKAKEVWDVVKKSYLDVSDSSQVYERMKKSFQSR